MSLFYSAKKLTPNGGRQEAVDLEGQLGALPQGACEILGSPPWQWKLGWASEIHLSPVGKHPISYIISW